MVLKAICTKPNADCVGISVVERHRVVLFVPNVRLLVLLPFSNGMFSPQKPPTVNSSSASGGHERLPTLYQSVGWLDLVETIIGAVNSWIPQLCHVQKTLSGSGPPQPMALVIFPPLLPRRPLDSREMMCVI